MMANIRVIKSSGYDLAWARGGRRDATKRDEFFIRLIDCADQFSDNRQGNNMKSIAQGPHHRLDRWVGQ